MARLSGLRHELSTAVRLGTPLSPGRCFVNTISEALAVGLGIEMSSLDGQWRVGDNFRPECRGQPECCSSQGAAFEASAFVPFLWPESGARWCGESSRVDCVSDRTDKRALFVAMHLHTFNLYSICKVTGSVVGACVFSLLSWIACQAAKCRSHLAQKRQSLGTDRRDTLPACERGEQ